MTLFELRYAYIELPLFLGINFSTCQNAIFDSFELRYAYMGVPPFLGINFSTCQNANLTLFELRYSHIEVPLFWGINSSKISKFYAKSSTWLLVKLTQNRWARRQKKFKSRYASLRPTAGLRPTLAFVPLRSK